LFVERAMLRCFFAKGLIVQILDGGSPPGTTDIRRGFPRDR